LIRDPKTTGTSDITDIITILTTMEMVNMSAVELICPMTSPAWQQIKLYGNEPKNVDIKNGNMGISNMGADMFMNLIIALVNSKHIVENKKRSQLTSRV
jgi:hypothetical protein